MGKKRKIQNDVDKEVVKIGNQKKDILTSKSTSNEIEYNVKRIKESKKEISTDNESSKSSLKDKKKNKHQKLKTNMSITGGNGFHQESNDDCEKNKKKKRKKQNETNDVKLQQEVDIKNDSKTLKKRKFNNVSEFEADEAHSSKELAVAKNKKSKRSTGLEEVNKDNELNEETLKITNKIGKKKKQDVKNEEIQISDTNNVNKEKPKKKKKRKNVEQEIVDDEEIDKYCNELDDFHNKQYENWVKLIEENLNKNVKK